jgi:MFS family permease
VLLALGITWMLDGLEASLIANLAPTLARPDTLGLTASQVGATNTAYLLGQVVGALFFGWLTDRKGRKKLFLVTLGLYLAATALGGLAPNLWVFAFFRFLAGAGIGGEYSAINSAIDEIVPAKVRGQVDLAINATYWVGVALGALLTLVVANPTFIPIAYGWRCAFGLGALLGLVILVVRRHIPESPRWLLLHGRGAEADATTREIEAAVYEGKPVPPAVTDESVHPTHDAPAHTDLGYLFRTLFVAHPRRTILGLSLMLAQAFFYNSIFFSYGLVLQKFHGVAPDHVGIYMVPFAIGNFAGPLLLGRAFDRYGRRVMIPLTYAAAGLLLVATGGAFLMGWLNAVTQTLAWCTVFFFASSAASAAYLTVSELFPLEIRGLVIAVFYAFATLLASVAPMIFGAIVDSGSPMSLFAAYAFASTLMVGAAIVARVLGVSAEGKSLEALRH